jgi:hypothetical protein
MFGLSRSHPGEIALDTFQDLPSDAWELARFWVTSERSFVSVGFLKQWAPELLGSLLIECVHNAAASYASLGTIPEDEALARIWRGIDDERQRLVETEINNDQA